MGFAPDRNLPVGPADNAAAITPHDTNELTYWTRGLYVGTAGDAVVVFADGTEITLIGLAAGTVYPFALKIVKATGTDAADLVALF